MKEPKNKQSYGVYFGVVDEKSVKAAQKSLLKILNAKCSEETKQAAITAMRDMCSVSGNSVSNSSFTL